MLSKIAIIAVALFAGVNAEEDEYEPFYLRMLNANTTAAPETKAVTTPAPTTKEVTTAAPETKAETTAAPETKEATTKPATTAAAGNTAVVTAKITFPIPAGVTAADFAVTLMGAAAAPLRAAMAKPLATKYCGATVGCSVAITAISVAARRARALAATGADFDIKYELTGLSAEKAAAVATITDADMATLTTEMVAEAKADTAAVAALTNMGLSVADLDTHVASKGVTVTVVTTAPATTSAVTTTTATTTVADATTAGAAEHSVFIAVAMVMFSKLLF